MMTKPLWWAVILLLVPLAVPQGVAGDATAVFRSEVELVNLGVSVTENGGRFVSNLRQNDFQVLEDGVPQDLSMFSQEALPVSLSILLDTSVSMQQKLREAQAAAIRFLRTLRPQDEAQVVQFNEKVRIVEDFTADLPRLEQAVLATRAAGATALYTAIYVALKELQAKRTDGDLRRLAVVVLSDGDDTASLVSDDQVLELARRAGVGIYGISLRSPVPSSALMSLGTPLPRFFLTSLTRDTGGEAHFLRSVSQLGGVYDRVAAELRAQYSMAYMSSNPARDGRWRNIVVRTPGRPDLTLRHRQGYYAARR